MPHTARFVSVFVLALGVLTSFARANEAELVQQAERQKQIQADTEHAVRRLSTMLRVLEYYQVDKSAEKKLLEEVAATLSFLSRSQMTEVIARLEAAAKAPDTDKADKELTIAYARHREIIDTLKDMLARYDAVKTLDQVADRLDKLSQSQVDLHLLTSQLLQDWKDRTRSDLPAGVRKLLTSRLRYQVRDLKKQVDDQAELQGDFNRLLKQAAGLRGKLTDEQKERLANMDRLTAKLRVHDNLTNMLSWLRLAGRSDKTDSWQEANELQWQTSGHLKELARVLRTPADLLAILREAREKLDKAITKQEQLEEQAKEQVKAAAKMEAEQAAKEKKNKLTFADLENLLKPDQTKPAQPVKKQPTMSAEQAEKNMDLAKQQARLEDETRATRDLIQEKAKPAAAKVEAAEQAMKDARAELKMNQADKAVPAQEMAVEKLKDARRDIDQMIAAAEKQKTDPLTAMKQAADDVAKLLKEQMETREQTKATAGEKQTPQMPELAQKQQDLAKRTEAMKDAPLPTNAETKKALAKANEAMKDAAKELANQKPGEAVPKQDMAIKALEQAKQELGQKIAEMENRRDAMAKLEEAGKKLGELAKQENKVAEGAKDLMQQPNADAAKNLAQKQDNLMPQAKEVGKQLEKAAPEAAQKVAEAGKQMEAAKNNLDKNQAPPAAMEAHEAAKNLMEAQKQVAKALEDMKGKELADQAAMQPNKVDANQAAQQIAKALEETQKAAEQAMQAEQAGKEMAKAEAKADNAMQKLAKMQEQLAKKADQMKLPEAGKEAGMAADALKKGDLPKAVQQQEAALAKMDPAAQKPAMADGQPKKAEAKDGDMKAGEAKPAEAKPGEKMPAEAKKGEAKPGEKMAGEAKKADAKAGEMKAGEAKPGEKMEEPAGNGKPETPAQLAQQQKDLMEATKALAKSQEATEAAMAALAQAQAQAPKGVQKPLEMANKELAKANQELNKGEAGEANKAQNEAANQLQQALNQLNAALTAMGQKPVQPGQPSQAVAKGDPMKPGQEAGKDGEQPMDGQEANGQTPGQGQAKEKGQGPTQQKGKAQEKNEPLGQGNRDPDGKVTNAKSQLNDVHGDGSFLHLPPRQRELIRQAMSGQLPPEYAALIQQYYINIARGRPAAMPTATPMKR